jgi:chromosome partitioning protein
MTLPQQACSVCGKRFEIKARWQVEERTRGVAFFCSVACHDKSLGGDDRRPVCTTCGVRFDLSFAYQVAMVGGERRFFCSETCRARGLVPEKPPRPAPRRIAVFNHKGGTGKTTTAVNLAAGIAERGKKVLLIDTDAQGNVGVSLGVHGERSLYHVLVLRTPARDCAVPVRDGLDVVTADEALAAAEIFLAGKSNRHRALRDALSNDLDYDVVVLDCSPSLNLLNQNALVYADQILVPVSCDYLSLVGMQQVLRTVANVNQLLRHPVSIHSVVPTFFDVRNRIAREAMAALQEHFADRVATPVRINTRLREAPMEKRTIFEYAPDSHGAEDYAALADRILSDGATTAQEALARASVA